MAGPPQLTRMHRVLIGVVVFGAVIIAGIGFAGSYAAVRELAIQKGFGNFSYVFPIGIDAGICVLLALDLLLTWIRIPFPLLRQTAWLLTAATIAFNGAAAWPDPLGVGMHGVIPILFVVSVEAARHAIGRIADITADKHMEGVRLTRWLLSPVPTFLLWRRMKLWELRSYEQVIKLEQERLVYQARLRSRFGRAWRRKAPVESLMPLRLARYGVPLAETAPAGLAAAGIEPALLPPAPQQARDAVPAAAGPAALGGPEGPRAAVAASIPRQAGPVDQRFPHPAGPPEPEPEYVQDWFNTPRQVEYHGGYDAQYDPQGHLEDWYAEQQQAEQYRDQFEEEPPLQEPSPEDTGTFPIPVTSARTRQLGEGGGTPAPEPSEEDYYQVFRQSIDGSYPTPRVLGDNIEATYGTSLSPSDLKTMAERFQQRHSAELEEDHIA
ncbi:Membrane protein OS=Streptomyces viridochromogenes OX=1938 GN=ACM01_40500 PE=4 SV=1 [Streptomyces viridochromogenes]